MADRLEAHLDRLRAGFADPAPSVAAAEQLFTAARRLNQICDAAAVRDQDCVELRSKLVALAQQLACFNAALAAAVAAGGMPFAVVQVEAGCTALEACATIGHAAQLDDCDIFRVSSAAQLMFDVGKGALMTMHHGAQLFSHLPAALASLANAAGIQLAAAAAVVCDLLRLDDQPAAVAFANSTGRPDVLLPWLAAVTDALLLASSGGEQGLLRCGMRLANYTALVNALVSMPPYTRHSQALAAAPALQEAMVDLLLGRCLPFLADLVAAAGLLDGSLRARQANVMLRVLGAPLISATLAPAAARRLRQPDGAALMQHAVSILCALPATCPLGVPPTLFIDAHGYTAVLLGSACLDVGYGDGSGGDGGDARGSGGIGGEGQGGPAACSSEEQRAAAWLMVRLIPRMAAVLAAAAGEPTYSQAGLGTLTMNYAGSLSLLDCLQVADGEQFGAWLAAADAAARLLPLLSRLDARWRQPQDQQQDQQQQQASIPTVQQQAACGLTHRLLTRMWQGMPVSMVARSGAAGSAAAGVMAGLARQAWQLHTSSCRLVHWLASDAAATLPAIELKDAYNWQLLEDGLHLQFQRAHVFLQDEAQAWEAAAGEAGRRQPCSVARRMQALCLAHWQAVQALEAAAAAAAGSQQQPSEAPTSGGGGAGSDGGGGSNRNARLFARQLVCSVLLVAADCPALVGPAFLALVERSLVALSQAEDGGEQPWSGASTPLLSMLVQAAADRPRLAAAMATGGLLGLVLQQQAARLAGVPEDREESRPQGKVCFAGYCSCVLAIERAAEEANSLLAGSGSGSASQGVSCRPLGGASDGGGSGRQGEPVASGSGGEGPEGSQASSTPAVAGPQSGAAAAAGGQCSVGQQLLAAAARLEGQLDKVASMFRDDVALPGQQVEELQQLLLSAAEVAALLQQHWQQQDQQGATAAAVELAQAAAARGCAYLRCANVGADGGPAAGEVSGSKRCAACRAVWYCGTACSHADWRQGGHKHVCSALAAARQQQRRQQGVQQP